MVIDRSIFGGPCSGEENTEVMLDSEWIGRTAPQDVCRVEGCSPCLYFMIQRGCAGSTCGWCHLRHDPRNESFGRFSLFSLITMTSPKDLGIFGVFTISSEHMLGRLVQRGHKLEGQREADHAKWSETPTKS